MAAPNVNGRLHLTGVDQKPPASLFLFGFTITKTGANTSLQAPKLSYFAGRVPQLSARVYQGTPAAGVIGHMSPKIFLTASLIFKLNLIVF